MLILLWKGFMWFLHFSLCFSILFNFPFQWQYILKNQQGDLSTCNQFIEKAEPHMERTKSRSLFSPLYLRICSVWSHLRSCYSPCVVRTVLPLLGVYRFKNCLPLSTQALIQSLASPPQTHSHKVPASVLHRHLCQDCLQKFCIKCAPLSSWLPLSTNLISATLCHLKLKSSLPAGVLKWKEGRHRKLCSLHILEAWTLNELQQKLMGKDSVSPNYRRIIG